MILPGYGLVALCSCWVDEWVVDWVTVTYTAEMRACATFKQSPRHGDIEKTMETIEI